MLMNFLQTKPQVKKETHNTDRARPYVFCFYRLSKPAGK